MEDIKPYLESMNAKIDRIMDRVEKDHDILIVNNEKQNNISKDVEVLFEKQRNLDKKVFKYAIGIVILFSSALGFDKMGMDLKMLLGL